tara:strand:+ start:520 stop:666 length:147 start_codon:yes stop_codon:yes gene_type:complete
MDTRKKLVHKMIEDAKSSISYYQKLIDEEKLKIQIYERELKAMQQNEV